MRHTDTKRLLLLSLDWIRPKDPRFSLGHASILARLRQVPGLEVASIDRAVNPRGFDRSELLAAVLAAVSGEETDLAIGVYVWNDKVVRWLLRALRQRGFTGRIFLGGPQISYAPSGIAAEYPGADAFIRGYGEDALAQAIVSTPSERMPGVVWRGQADRAESAAVDLGRLPSPILSGVLPVQPFMRWETQRGCVYACSFCQHREAGARLRRRTLAPGRIADEVVALVEGGAADIAVLDPIFNTNPDAGAILRRFADLGYRGRLSLQARFELLDEELLDACERLDVRLEFGLQTVHDSEMKAVRRMNHLGKVEAAMGELYRRGVPFEVSLIYGLPTQTLSSFEETVRWCADRGAEVIRAFPLMLLRGTALEQERRRWGLLEDDGDIPVVVQSDSFTRADWEQMRARADCLSPDRLLQGAA